MPFTNLQKTTLRMFSLLALAVFVVGCATPKNYDKFKAARVRSILVLPPKNFSTDIRGTYSFLSTVTMPIAEKGFYVFPVAVVDQMMKENGVPSADEMHQVSLRKIKEIINPDAVLYITLEQYGSKFVLVQSQTTVAASGKLVSASTGEVLWEGRVKKVVASSDGGGGLGGMLVGAMVSQAINTSVDQAHQVSVVASEELFMENGQGLIDGPYKDKPASKK